MSQTVLLQILEKIASKDKDFRYMATSDLVNELQRDSFKADPDLEKKLSVAILNQLEDASGDISNLATACLGLLVQKIADVRAEELIRNLCVKLLTGKKEQQREIAAIGLRTVIKEIHGANLATAAANTITNKLLEGVSAKDVDGDVLSQSLDILTDLMHKFGHLVAGEHKRLVELLLPLLDDSRQLQRKKALHCLAAVCVFLTDDLLNGVVGQLLTKLQAKGLKPDLARTYTQAIGQISRAVGYRFGRHLIATVPLIVSYCDKAGEGDDELREYCLQALEGLVLRLPRESRPQLQPMLTTALKYLRYDPNFSTEDDDDEDMEEDGEEDEEAEGSDDEYSDDEDVSWKVRRSSAKTLSAIINAYPDALSDIYPAVAPELINRFKEREESVKMDVFNATSDLLRQVGAVSARHGSTEATSPMALLQADVPGLLKAIAKQVKDKSPKTKVGAFTVLRGLVTVLPQSMSEHVGLLVPGVLHALQDKSSHSSNLKIEALSFLRLAVSTSDPGVFQPHLKVLAPPIFAATGERYYKVSAEALRVCEALVLVLRPSPTAPVPPAVSGLVPSLFSNVLARLSAQDQDLEVKECAILCMARVVASLGDVLTAETPGVLKLLLDRLRNEVTRLTAVKAITVLAQSPLPLDLSSVVEPVTAELTSFLRKVNRLLRQASLVALEAVVAKYGPSLDATTSSSVVEEASALISDSDLSLAQLALRCLATLLKQQPAAASSIVAKSLPPTMVLVRSPLLQGGALEVLQAFLAQIATSGSSQASFENLLQGLLDAGRSRDAASKQAQNSVAQCVAVLTAAAGGTKVTDTVTRLLTTISKPTDQASHRLALLSLGEIGRRVDLAHMPQVAAAISASLQADSEEIKTAGSAALGGVTCGNLHAFLPPLLAKIAEAQSTPKRQYLLLQALSEVISTISAAGQATALNAADQQQVLQLLLANCEGEEECRNVVAECLGHLALLFPEPVLSALEQGKASPSANMRCVVVSAIKYTAVEKAHPVDAYLSPRILSFLLLIGDPDRHVRKAAVVALSGTAHQKASLVAGHLEQLLPLLYEQTIIREDMIRTVDLGPFKHRIDDGLDLRKAAFECLDILLDTCRGRLDVPAAISHLESGLKDHYDVKMPSHLMLAKLAATDPGATLAALDRLVDPLEKTLTTKLKSDAVKQEIDRHEDMLRSCLRAVDALRSIPGSDAATGFQTFMRRTVMGTPLREKFLAIEKERAEAEGSDAMDLS